METVSWLTQGSPYVGTGRQEIQDQRARSMRNTRPDVAGLDHRRGEGPRNSSRARDMQESRFSPKPPERDTAPILAQWDLLWTSGHQNCKLINLCCLKPLSVWWFVTAAIRNILHKNKSLCFVISVPVPFVIIGGVYLIPGSPGELTEDLGTWEILTIMVMGHLLR